ncbi:hypothetical protein DID88_007899 [Monilinia fructigena]|uniref:SNF2 N-terminal domain-containing protein n=1 Tax=Monilinia fructigena TaxID=38457 RepID=A0A395J3Q6_9HELO|nr:hypothetical protein DID88_007899 [Monilinia fructigena]
MKNGRGDVAIKRLRHYLQIFMKRRTKEILKKDGALNPGGKPSVSGEGNSTGFQGCFYERLEQRTDASIEEMMDGRKVNYASALVLLLRLRQACNHPQLVGSKLGKDTDALSAETKIERIIEDSDDEEEEGEWLVGDKKRGALTLGKAGGKEDENCEGGGEWLDSDHDSDLDDSFPDLKDIGKKKVDDEEDVEESTEESQDDETSEEASEEESDVEDEFGSDEEAELFQELLHLLRSTHLMKILGKEAAHISLSSFRSSRRCWILSSHSYARRVSSILDMMVLFSSHSGIPLFEEQAIDRVHRLTQKIDVIVYKITIKDTVEERILLLQEKKRELANQTIEGGKGGAEMKSCTSIQLSSTPFQSINQNLILPNLNQTQFHSIIHSTL